MYRSNLEGGPDTNKSVGGPARSEEAAKLCTAAIWRVGPTLIKRNAGDAVCNLLESSFLYCYFLNPPVPKAPNAGAAPPRHLSVEERRRLPAAAPLHLPRVCTPTLVN